MEVAMVAVVLAKDVFQVALATSRGRRLAHQRRRPAHGGRHESQMGHTIELRNE